MTTGTADQVPLPSAGNPPARLVDLRAIRVVLFDLDGTLHDDSRVTDRYASILEEIIPDGGGLGLRAEAEAVAGREHPALRPGVFAEPVRGIVVHAPEWAAETATDWEGRPVPVPADLQGRVRHDGPLRYLGDSWQIIGALAARRGADQPIQRDAFALARRFINHEATSLIRLEHLDEVLDRLAPGRHLLLATNTPEDLARPLVDRLALRQPFAVVRFDARKPTGCTRLILQARRMWGTRPSEILVVGDNLWNDLLPPAGQGCRTVHIDPLGTDLNVRWSSARFENFTAFAAALRELPDDT